MTIKYAKWAGRNACVLAIVASGPILGGCSIPDFYTADPAFSENTRGGRVALSGDMPTFDLLVDCMPADLEAPTKVVNGHRLPGECKDPTMRRIGRIRDAEQQAIDRNRFQDYLLMRSTQQCGRHTAGFTGFQSTTNFTLNTLTTGVAAVAAIVTAPASNILAAIAAFTSGTRSHFNEDIYQKLFAFAVVTKIKETREQELIRINLKRTIQSSSTSKPRGALMGEYTLEAAIADVERYHQLCSFTSGLSALVDPTKKFDDTATGLRAYP